MLTDTHQCTAPSSGAENGATSAAVLFRSKRTVWGLLADPGLILPSLLLLNLNLLTMLIGPGL